MYFLFQNNKSLGISGKVIYDILFFATILKYVREIPMNKILKVGLGNKSFI